MERGANVLVPAGSSASAAAKRYTSKVPIAFLNVGNPVGIGLVDSLSTPGRSATEFSDAVADLSGKWVELARDVGRPHAPIECIWYSGWPDGQNRLKASERVAQSLGVKLRARGISSVAEINDDDVIQ